MDPGASGRWPAWYYFFMILHFDIFNFLTNYGPQSRQTGRLLLCLFTYFSFPLDGDYLEAGTLSWASLDLQAWLRAWPVDEAQ